MINTNDMIIFLNQIKKIMIQLPTLIFKHKDNTLFQFISP